MINFQFFARSHGLTSEMRQIIDCFVAVDAAKTQNQHLQSNDMLALLRPHLETYGFRVETGKKMEEKIEVPAALVALGDQLGVKVLDHLVIGGENNMSLLFESKCEWELRHA